MRNTKLKIRFIENFIIATFPLALAVGCSVTGEQKPSDVSMQDDSSIQQQSSIEANELNTLTFIETEPTDSSKIASIQESVAVDTSTDMENTQQDTQVMESEDSIEPEISNQASDNTEETAFLPVNVPAPEVTNTKEPESAIVHFAVNKFDISENDLAILQNHADYLKENPSITVNVNGYSDNRGSAKWNFELSKKRAQQVADALIELGVAESQIKVNSYGESFPLHDENNWDENRRVELQYTETPRDDDPLMAKASENE